ncbi:putative malonyl CoA-acyl carrier protein transacylase [Talaromyces proteolyticus]|uniref:[acyl-carrier-protein] S-malonyltransferase n=1 Tax=Talaromyces proteolyticus TaxID=1131652 RepID=A0AAD4PXG2_9EURO|nr:putative malonyl CoA-acyl carrier protein transacylase [Talaromyces proteolyticus]KAH8693106.1 putative malonyl CoA-acyl carrier protein transacylase [Talaromyces proteolyticus]
MSPATCFPARCISGTTFKPFSTNSANRTLRTALFFPGHGVHRVGMISSWVEAFPKTSKPFIDEMDSTLGFSLSRIVSRGPNSELNKTENSQPSIMATSILILRILEREFGFKTKERVDVALGHSLGEYSALVAGGYLDFLPALRMVRGRAEVMAQCSQRARQRSGESYGMIALICEPDHLQSLISAIQEFLGPGSMGSKDDSSYEMSSIQQVLIANINSKNQIVLSGSIQRIKTLLVQLRQFGGHDPRAVRLKSDSPFHSPIMAPAAQYMRTKLETTDIKFPAAMPCVSNVSAVPFTSKENLKDLLSRQCVETVRWWDSIRYLDQERGVKRWIGIGPGKVGRNLVGKEVGRIPSKGGGVWAICDPREVEDVINALEKSEHEDTDDV